MRVPFTPGTPLTPGKPLFTEVTPRIREVIITTTIITGTTEDTMAGTGTTPMEATTVDIGTAGITAVAINGAGYYPYNSPFFVGLPIPVPFPVPVPE